MNEVKDEPKKSVKNIVIVILSFFLLWSLLSNNSDKSNELENQVKELTSRVEEYESQISILQKENSEQKNTISRLQNENKILKTEEEQENQVQQEVPQENINETSNSNTTVPASSSSNSSSLPSSSSVSNSSSSNSSNSYTNEDNKEEIVWVGNTGTKYHRQDCRTLKGKGHQITLEQALAEGREACNVCY